MYNINELISIFNYLNNSLGIVPREFVNSNELIKKKIINLINLKLNNKDFINLIESQIESEMNYKKILLENNKNED